MSSSGRSLIYRTGTGGFIASINNYIRIETIRVEKNYGSLYLDVPDIYVFGYFKLFGILEVWKARAGFPSVLEGDTCYIIVTVEYKDDESGKRYIHIVGYDANFIIKSRINPYYSNSAKAKMTGKPDDLIKAIMRNNAGSLVDDPLRDLSTYLVIADDEGLCTPEITEAFAWQEVLPELQQICNRSMDENGQYLSFDITYDNEHFKFYFNTYVGQRGVDRGGSSTNPVVLSITRASLSYSSLTYNAQDAVSVVYAGGQGYEDKRTIQVAKDDAMISLSPFARVEDFYNASDESLPENVLSAAKGYLASHGIISALNGHIAQTPGSLYEIHYGFGDIVVGKYRGVNINIHLDRVHMVDDASTQKIEIYARNLEDNAY